MVGMKASSSDKTKGLLKVEMRGQLKGYYSVVLKARLKAARMNPQKD